MTEMKDLTLGKRIQALRRAQGLTQEALAEYMEVTPQAVSKWENDLSCPDIMSLPKLAEVLHTTVDTLLTGASPERAHAAPAKKPEELIVRMVIRDEDTRVCLNLPFTVFRLGAMYAMISFDFHGEEGNVDAELTARAMAGMDFKQLVAMIEQGARGTLVQVADILTIWTE